MPRMSKPARFGGWTSIAVVMGPLLLRTVGARAESEPASPRSTWILAGKSIEEAKSDPGRAHRHLRRAKKLIEMLPADGPIRVPLDHRLSRKFVEVGKSREERLIRRRILEKDPKLQAWIVFRHAAVKAKEDAFVKDATEALVTQLLGRLQTPPASDPVDVARYVLLLRMLQLHLRRLGREVDLAKYQQIEGGAVARAARVCRKSTLMSLPGCATVKSRARHRRPEQDPPSRGPAPGAAGSDPPGAPSD